MTTRKKSTPAIGRKVVKSDPDCDTCKGKGWVLEGNGWPIECRCVFRLAVAKAKHGS